MSDQRSRILIIAEAGVNHNGSLDTALALVTAAAEAGADVVKFQSFQAAALVSRQAPKAAYQKQTTGAEESQLAMLKRLELDAAAHERLVAHCAACGIEFLSTPFDPASLQLLAVRLDLPRLKLGSGELTDAPLLLAAGRTGKPVILSTGMATLAEVECALGILAYGYLGAENPSPEAFAGAFAGARGQRVLCGGRVTLLHCTSAYPTPYEQVDLRAMDTLREAFGLPVGLSDHTLGTTVAVAAAGRGAAVIEKHFTLDRDLPGPDHQASLEPGELADMVRAVRQVELALGDGRKEPTAAERQNRSVVRKSLVAAQAVRRGELFSTQNLTVKRPGTGLAPINYWQVLGRRAPRDFAADEMIELSSEPTIVVGAGSHARVVIEAWRLAGGEILGCVAPRQPSALPPGVAYLGTDDGVEAYPPGEVLLLHGVGSTGDPELRIRLFVAFRDQGYRFATLVHPSAVVATDVVLAAGAQIMAGAILQPGCRVGENAIANTGAVIDHDGRIGAHAHVAPRAVLCGDVTVGRAAHVGAGASVMQGRTIGAGSVVGTGAVVVRDVPSGVTVAGVPARILKR